jgi:hypothetical protein
MGNGFGRARLQSCRKQRNIQAGFRSGRKGLFEKVYLKQGTVLTVPYMLHINAALAAET